MLLLFLQSGDIGAIITSEATNMLVVILDKGVIIWAVY